MIALTASNQALVRSPGSVTKDLTNNLTT